MATEQYYKIREYITDEINKVYPSLKLYNNVSFYEDIPYMMEQNPTTIRHLIVGLNDFDYFSKKITSRGFQCTLELVQIEEILIPLQKKFLALNSTINNSPTIWFNTYTDSQKDEIWDSFKKYDDIDLVTNPEVLDALCAHFIEVIGKHFIPFWEKHTDLQYINDEIIDKIPDSQISRYLSGMTPFKKLIIMRICKNKDYEIFKQEVLERGIKAVQEDAKTYLPYQNLFNEMIQIIESKY